MNNCLVTKLKASVDNDNLDVLGKCKVRIVSGGTPSCILRFTEDTVVKLVNCTWNGQNIVNIGNSTVTLNPIVLTGDNPYIEIDKYKVITIVGEYISVDFDNLDYIENMYSLKLTAASGDVSKLMPKIGNTEISPSMMRIYDGDISGDVSGLGLGGFIGDAVFPGNATRLHGNLVNMANMTNTLTSVTLPHTSSVYFDIIAFVKRARKVGVTTKSTIINFIGTNYGNVTVGDNTITTSRVELTWTPTTITYNGTTIDNSEVEP